MLGLLLFLIIAVIVASVLLKIAGVALSLVFGSGMVGVLLLIIIVILLFKR